MIFWTLLDHLDQCAWATEGAKIIWVWNDFCRKRSSHFKIFLFQNRRKLTVCTHAHPMKAGNWNLFEAVDKILKFSVKSFWEMFFLMRFRKTGFKKPWKHIITVFSPSCKVTYSELDVSLRKFPSWTIKYLRLMTHVTFKIKVRRNLWHTGLDYYFLRVNWLEF